MPNVLVGSVSNADTAAFALGACVILLAITQYFQRRRTPQDQERDRRAAIQRNGKIGDCEIIDVDGDSIVYSYMVAGVAYTASQDVTELKELLPPDPPSILGPASVKFIPRNPANSMVLCEEWTGLRRRESQRESRRA